MPKLRLINSIFRIPFAFVVTIIIALVVYIITIFVMIFFNWDEHYQSLKEIHTCNIKLFYTIAGMNYKPA